MALLSMGGPPGVQAAHLILLRDIQAGTGGFTEFVPLGFVASEAPMYKQVCAGDSRHVEGTI